MNTKVLFLMQLPPPTHGTSLPNSWIAESEVLKENFDCRTVKLNTSEELKEMEQWSPGKILGGLLVLTRLLKALVCFRPDVVYFTPAPAGPAFFRDVLYALFLKFSPARTVHRLHNSNYGKLGRLNYFLTSLMFWRSVIVVQSEKLKNENVISTQRDTYVIHNGIPREYLESIDPEFQDEPTEIDSEVTVLYLANLRRAKGVFDLIEAVDQVMSGDHEPFAVDVVGGESGEFDMDQLHDLIDEKGLNDTIRLKGSRYGLEKGKSFRQADVFAFPSHDECFPIVLLEAMYFGLPLLSTAVGGVPDMIADGENGFVTVPRAPEKFAKKLKRLINDPDLRGEMSEASKKRFRERFRFKIEANNLRNVFRKNEA